MNRRILTVHAGALAIGVLCGGAAQAATWYVNGSAKSTRGSGTSWDKAFKTVQAGINAAAPGDEVWVAKGLYAENLSMTALTGDGVALYGGFAGTEVARDQRNIAGNTTIIDGGFRGSVISIRNCPSGQTRVDGFTIRSGEGNGINYGTDAYCGGGIYSNTSSPTVANNTITGNRAAWGAGVGCYGAGNPVITGNTISGNRAHTVPAYLPTGYAWGGGICSYLCNNLTISDNNITSNYASFQGGGLALHGSGPTTIQVTRNRITNNGGNGGLFMQWDEGVVSSNLVAFNQNYGMVNNGPGAMTITNNTVVGNPIGIILTSAAQVDVVANNIVTSNTQTGIHADANASQVILENNDVFGNGVNYVGSAIPATNTDISADPLFAFATTRDYHLSHNPLSPCLDAGNNAYASTRDKDLDGKNRIIDGVVDIGCYESGSIPPYTTCTLAGTLGLNGWYRSPVTATLTPSEIVASTKYAYRETATNYTTYTGPFSLPFLGIGSLFYYSSDPDGNVEALRSTPVKIDTILPTLTVTSPTTYYTYTRTTPIAFAGTASDSPSGLLSVTWKASQGGSGTCAGTTSWSASIPLVEGYNWVDFQAKDMAGNSRTTNRPVILDTIPPSISINSFAGTIVSGVSPVTVSGTATDTGSGVKSVRWANPAAGVSGTCLSISPWSAAIPLVSGAQTLTFTATDWAGNTRTIFRAAIYTPVDTTPPTVPAPPTGGVYTAPIVITFSEPIAQGTAFTGITVKDLGARNPVDLVTARTINGSQLTLTATMSARKTYTVTLPASCVKDLAGNNFGGLTFTYATTR